MANTILGLAFYDALVNNSLSQLKRHVELHKIDLNARLNHVRKRNHTDLCPVHLVTYKGYFTMLHYLIQNGVNVHQATSTLQRRAVHFAALRHQVSCLQMLLNAGAQVDAQDTFGNTPLHYAAEDGDSGLLSLLLNNGARVDSQDITNKTPLMKAARSGKIWAIRRLISAGANVDVKDRNDETALHFACRQGSTEITSMLIKAGAKPNAQNLIGLTPIMEAVSYNQRDAVRLLVRNRNVDLYKRDFCTGDTALHIAVKRNYIHMVDILLQAGNWYIEYNYNNLGESIVHDVIAYNRLELFRLFLTYNYDFDQPAKRLPSSILYAHLSPLTVHRNLCDQIPNVDKASLYGSMPTSLDKSPFQLAVERGHLDLARIMADVGCYRLKFPITSGPLTSLTPWTLTADRLEHKMNNPLSRRYCGLLEVKSLKKWCRRSIRQHFGFHLLSQLPHLSLPNALKEFILLSDLDWSVCWGGPQIYNTQTASDLMIVPTSE